MIEFFLLLLVVCIVTGFVLLARLWRLRSAPGATALILSNLSLGFWALGYGLEILLPGLAEKVLWARLQYVGIAFLSLWFLLFVLAYTGRAAKIQISQAAALMIVPTLTVLFVLTGLPSGWLWSDIQLQAVSGPAPLVLSHGWWFWVHTAYAYILLLTATLQLLRFARGNKVFGSQSRLMLIGLMAPWLSNVLYITGIQIGPSLDFTPIAFAITNLLLVLAFVRFRLFDILPVAYTSIFQSISDGVVVLDNKGRVIDANPAAKHLFASSGGLVIGGPLHVDLPEAESSRELTLSVDGQNRTYIIRSSPVLATLGRKNGKLAIFSEITELKRAHNQMHLQVTALEAAGNAIVITSADGRIEWANPAFSRLTGYTLEEVVGKHPSIFKSGQQSPEFYKNLWETILAGQVWHGELTNRRKNGEVYYEEMTITPVSREDGSPTTFIAIKQDVTDRKRAEAKLQRAHQEALRANQLKTQLLANISHDLRAPLGAIIGYAEMLAEGVYGDMSHEQKGITGEIIDSANQQLMFVNNLIGQAQVETGRIRFVPREFPPHELLEIPRSVTRQLAEKKGLRMEFTVDPALPETLYGDPYWLRQIVLNLTTNAVKFTEQGSVRVCLMRLVENHWAIEVTDTGIGIGAEAQSHIFEPFFQGDNLGAGHFGSGLGLSIVNELATRMGGTVSLQSRLGAGSTFRVTFPMEIVEQA